MKAIKWLDQHFEECFLVIFLVLIAVVSLMQVIVRNIETIPALTWAEEFCRFCWIASVFLSLPYTIRNISMLRVCVLLDLLPEKVHKVINIAVYFITAACMALLAWYSVDVVAYLVKSGEKSPGYALAHVDRIQHHAHWLYPGDLPGNPAGGAPHHALWRAGADHSGADHPGRGAGGRGR